MIQGIEHIEFTENSRQGRVMARCGNERMDHRPRVVLNGGLTA